MREILVHGNSYLLNPGFLKKPLNQFMMTATQQNMMGWNQTLQLTNIGETSLSHSIYPKKSQLDWQNPHGSQGMTVAMYRYIDLNMLQGKHVFEIIVC